MKIQNNNNSGDVVNGDKIGLDEQGVSAMLDDKQRKFLDNARLNLNKAVSEENIESKKVLSYCAEIKRFLPDDFMANFYEVACEGTEKQLNKFLGDIDIEKNRKHVKEIADFLLKGMEYSSVLPLKNLVDISLSGDEKTKYLTAIEQEADKIKEGVYSTQVPRDVFVAYSSKDYKKVNEIVEYLEDNKITCFVALRNLRHGKGALEHYDEALKEAMHNCDCVVFLSSNNSRSLECDALKQEIPYIRDHEPKMGRIEYLLEEYNEDTSSAAKRICEKFFKNIEYCKYIEDLVDRVTDYITGFDDASTDPEKFREKIKYCLACGAKNPQRSKFCIECGAKDFSDYQGYINAKNYLSERRAELEEEYAKKYKKQQEELQKEFGNRQKELDEFKKQKPEEDGKQREVIETQAEEPKLKSPQKPENPVGQIERPESELQPPKPAYSTLENYDKNEFEIEDGILIYYKGNKTNVIIPNGVTSIGNGAFQFRTSLTSITIPDSVTSVGNMAFRGCDSLTSITVAEGNTNYSSQDGVLYNKDKTRLIRVPLAKTSVTIPNCVTSIGNGAFGSCTSLTSITIPDIVTSIGGWAFYNCTSLTSITVAEGNTRYSSQDGVLYNKDKTELIKVPQTKTSITIPDSVTSIREYAFGDCTSLTSVTIDNGVTSIGGWTFCWCKSLTNITIPDSVTSIGCYAFDGCTNLESISVGTGNQNYASQNGILYNKDKTDILFVPIAIKGSVTIPDSVTSIGSYTFSGRESLESVTIPNSVTSIGSWAFNGCTNLTSITIPDSVTSIGREAFYGCTNLTSITIGNSVTSIENSTFKGCTSLQSITIPDSVTSIGREAFYNCTSLTSITIPDSVTSIGEYAFGRCESLTNIAIPDGVTSIGSSAFSGCTSLESITVSDNNTAYASRDGILYNKEKTKFIHIPQAIKGAVTIPDSITSIGQYAFSGCTSLESVIIPDSVASIGVQAFYNCTSLESVTIGNGVTSIGKYAFSRCESLTSISIPDSVTSIGGGAFYNCTSLESVIIPDSVASIGVQAFYNCTSLESVTIGNGVTSIGDNSAFSGCTSLKNITVTDGNTTYSSQDGILYNKNKTELIRVPQTKTSVTIPESVTSIGSYAFSGCTAEIKWGANPSIKEIGYSAFSRYKGTSITIPDSVTSIGYAAFWGCTSLESITIPNGVTSIGYAAFWGCTSLESITIPNGVTSIDWDAFRDCTSLKEVIFKNTTGWQVSKISSMSSAIGVTVTDSARNATLLTQTYCGYYWERKQN